MSEEMTIYVPEQSIKAGKQNDYKNCPIALSLRCHGLKHVRVFAEEIQYRDYFGIHIVPIPKRLQKKIAKFDDTGWVTPFSFEIDNDRISF